MALQVALADLSHTAVAQWHSLTIFQLMPVMLHPRNYVLHIFLKCFLKLLGIFEHSDCVVARP
eukprot:9584540-Karenia_brevis.AAC.1